MDITIMIWITMSGNDDILSPINETVFFSSKSFFQWLDAAIKKWFITEYLGNEIIGILS